MPKSNKKVLVFLILQVLPLVMMYGQDIGNLKDEKPFTISGGVGGGLTFFSSNEPNSSRDPFTWNLHGSFIPSIYGLSLPFSFNVSQYSESYEDPFTQFGISPSYKWAKLHLGYRSIQFSPFVFDGQNFLGAGVEINPGLFYLASFYGRTNKAISIDTTQVNNAEPKYARNAYGIKVGIKDSSKELTLMYMRVKDKVSSIKKETSQDSLYQINPEGNTVLGLTWKFPISKSLTWQGDIAASLLTRDISLGVLDEVEEVKIPKIIQKISPFNYTSVFSWSGQTQLSLSLKKFNAMIGYKRIQPDFKSLGIPYMIDDIEMINVNMGARLIKGKWSMNAAFTTQNNNLDGMRNSKLVTNTGNFSTNIFVSNNFNINANLTGVEVQQKDGLTKLTDSTRVDQLMLTYTLVPSLNFTGEAHQHSISTSLTYTDLNDKNPATQEQTKGNNFNASANYSLYFIQKYFGVNSNVIYSNYKTSSNEYSSVGLNLGANVQLLKKHNLMLQANAGYFVNEATDSPTGNNTTFNFSANFSPNRHHRFGISTSYTMTPPVNLNPLNEIDKVPYAVNSKLFSGSINYTYKF
ncbi:MAG: hypothetical protein ACTHYV_01700 [Psychroflexus sp.]|uniref:hypothetical protein n=1 Tax=Psychroflexus sp. S27 TaxID=1982757 RepID=UPI00128FD828|nr:hypothetical protein [Psychroflexus sp. S27]